MSLESALKQIDAQFGQGSIMRLGQDVQPIEVIPTGSMALNWALGVGGYPRGRVVEIFGPESSGKSTLCLQAVASCQSQGGTVAYIDTEYSLDLAYAQNLGVDTDAMLVSQPTTGEQALEIMDLLVKSEEVALVVIDSVAAMVPRAELDGDAGDSHVGLHARMMSQAMRRMSGILGKTSTTAIFVNQLRDVIGNMGFGPRETTTGGRALRYYSSVRLDVRRIETEKDKKSGEATGNRTRVKIVKNKVAPPFRQAEFSIRYGEGISREIELLDLGKETGVVVQSGAWFKYGDIQLGQGEENARQKLAGDKELANEIEALIRGKL